MFQSKEPTARSAPAPGQAIQAGLQQYLTFVLSGEVFGIGILAIKEIIEYAQPTSVPMTPAYVRGVINLRGAVVPVLDLAVRFGRAAAAVSRRTCIVIVEIEAGRERFDVGVIVDAVNAVVDIPDADVQPPPSLGGYAQLDFIHGMGKVDARFVMLLDVNKVLAQQEVAALSEMSASPVAGA
ncbi:MAG TPA: chemotaxis protein CheW [Steroidobacteraceae bacterium]